MPDPNDPVADPARLAALRRTGLMDSPPEDAFDQFTRAAARVMEAPLALVSLVDAERQFFKSVAGPVTGDTGAEQETPLSHSLCRHAIATRGPLVLPDARADPRFSDHPAVTGDAAVRFYAGLPLHAHGEVVGTLCLIDDKPRDLSEAEDRMLADLAQLLEQEMATDRDRREAQEVQRRLLPRREVRVPGLQVAGHCEPARTVGGDFYDWQEVAGGRLQVVVADVMGKGLVAAVIAAAVRTLMRSTSPYNTLADSVTRTGIDTLDDLDDVGTFVTMFAARIDPTSGALDYVDAGHGLALLLQPDGEVRRLHSAGLPLGAVPGEHWTADSEVLAPGETLLMVSDGVLDAFHDLDEALAAARELAALGGDAHAVVRRVTARVAELTTSDDITVVAVRREAA